MKLPKQYRQYIHINQQPCIELDFTAMHLNMLHARSSPESFAPLNYEPITINNIEIPREIIKSIVLIGLNCAYYFMLSNAYRQEETYHYQWLMEHGFKLSDIMPKIIEQYPMLEGHLPYQTNAKSKPTFSAIGLRLQYEDSEIMNRIMQQAMRDTLVLPIHDGVLCLAEKELTVRAIMIQCFNHYYHISHSYNADQLIKAIHTVEQ